MATVTAAGAVLALTAATASMTAMAPAASAASPAPRAAVEPAASAAAAGGQRMPEFRGRGLIRVFSGVDYRTKVEVRDIGGGHRNVLWPPSWKVCAQYPAAGQEIGDRTVRVGVVKHGEKCPPGATV
ncbi:hypothetical protein [Streptomyces sp. WG-D5]